MAEVDSSLVADQYEPADPLFVDDLVAAIRFKTFLLSRGEDVPDRVSEGMSRLVAAFRIDIEKHLASPALPRFEEFKMASAQTDTPPFDEAPPSISPRD
jgi:hypothetical protein